MCLAKFVKILAIISSNGFALNLQASPEVEIGGTFVAQGSVGINGYSKSTVNIKDKAIIKGSDSAIDNSCIPGKAHCSSMTITIGEKDGNVNIEYPKIISEKTSIYNSTGLLNYYDGVLIGTKDNSIVGKIDDIEENIDESFGKRFRKS